MKMSMIFSKFEAHWGMMDGWSKTDKKKKSFENLNILLILKNF